MRPNTHPLLPLQIDELAEVAASDIVHDDRQVVRRQEHFLRGWLCKLGACSDPPYMLSLHLTRFPVRPHLQLHDVRVPRAHLVVRQLPCHGAGVELRSEASEELDRHVLIIAAVQCKLDEGRAAPASPQHYVWAGLRQANDDSLPCMK